MAVLDFEEKETLNFNLLKYLFEKMANSKQLETIINQLSKESNLEFMHQFFNYTHNWGNYVAILNKLWPSFFKEMLETDVFPRKTIYDYSTYSLYFSSLEDISNINIDNCLTDFITNASDYLYIPKPDIEKLIKGFKHLGVSFKAINYEASDKELFRAVYENSLYDLNFANIKLMLTIMEKLTNEDSLIKDLFSSGALDQSNKLTLLTERIPLLSRTECFQAFNVIGLTDFASIFETRKHPKFFVCKENQNVLDKLQTMGWIYDYYADENDGNYYKIRRNKPPKKLSK